MLFRAFRVVFACLVGAGSLVCLPVGGVSVAAESVGTQAADVDTARALAVSSGQRVEVLDERSETGQVFANPSGTLTLEQHNRPVRVRRGDGWVPVDTTLVRAVDGSVAPVATVVGIELSGGGSTPLLTVARGQRRLSLTWPGALPVPVIAGDTATYREVLPAVDLEVRALVEGVSQVLVVKTAEAAGNPALQRVRFGVQASGLQLRGNATAGVVDAVDDAGEVVFSSGTPLMWDSADRLAVPGAAPGTALAPGAPERHEVAMPVEIAPDELAVLPDQAMLTAPDTVFPVRIDPPWHDATTLAWTMVNRRYPNQSYWAYDRAEGAKVGYSSTDNVTYRSLFRMNTAPVNGKDIITATFRIWEYWSWSCDARWVELWRTGPFDSATTWNNQPGGEDWTNSWNIWQWSQNVAKGYSSSCGAGTVEFNAVNAVREAANNGWTDLTLGLRAYDESDTFGWKKFSPDPVLSIEYNSYPDPPGDPYADIDLPCTTGTGRPWTNADVTLHATGKDADGGNVAVQFAWQYLEGGSVGGTTTASLASGTRFFTSIPVGTLLDGRSYSWRARVYDGSLYGQWGPWCEFSVDTTPPTAIPSVASAHFPEFDIGIEVGMRGEFVFTSADPDIVGYKYGLSEGAPYFVAAGTDANRTATVPVTMWDSNPHDMYVFSVDRAGNRSRPENMQTYPRYNFMANEPSTTPTHVGGDVDGDGLGDVFATTQRDPNRTAFLTFTSNGTGYYWPDITWDSADVNTGFRYDKIQTVSGDVNGDGRSDAVVFRDEGSGRTKIWVFYGNGVGFVAPVAPAWDSGAGQWLWSAARYVAGDFNGDGKTDLGGFYDYGGSAKLWLFYGTATGVSAPTMVWDSGAGNWGWGASRELAADFNGDGRDDLGAFYNYGGGRTKLWVMYGTATGVQDDVMVWDSGVGGWAWALSKETAGDFDGDGRDDVAAFYDYGSGQTKLWLFRGTATGVSGPVMKWDSGVGMWIWGSIKAAAADRNGDGRGDVIAAYKYLNRRTKLWTFDGTTAGFTAPAMRWDSGDNGLDWDRTDLR